MTRRFGAAAALAAAALLLAACGGGGGIGGTGIADGGGGGGTGGTGGTGGALGTLRVSMTDAPSCGYDAVNISVQKVRVHRSAAAGDADAGWSEVALSPARRVDLLTLTNGVLLELGQTALPAGKYTQLRLVLGSNGSATPFANSVVPSGGSETALDTPSGQQSGVKLNVDITVEPDKIADFVLDFDACKSVVRRGSSGRFSLKPVIAAIPRLSDAGQRIVGFVDPAIALGSTVVSVQSNGTVVRSTPPDATGRFVLYPVAPGTYDLVVTADGRAAAVMTGVPVTITEFTFTNPETARIAPPTSTARSASGTVSVGGSVVDTLATVAASQSLAGGPTVQIAAQPVDGLTGGYSFTLPVAAPVKTAYVAAATTLTFGADASAAGKYTLVASVPGQADKTVSIDIGGAPAVSPFAFP